MIRTVLARSLVLPALVLAGCARVVPVAVPEPVADDSTGAVEYYTRTQRDVMAALTAEFPQLRFEQRYGKTSAGCRLPDGSAGAETHLPIHGSVPPVPADGIDRAVEVFEAVASRAGFHGRQVLPPDAGFAIRMFAADGSYITFGSYVAATVGLTVGCYRK